MIQTKEKRKEKLIGLSPGSNYSPHLMQQQQVYPTHLRCLCQHSVYRRNGFIVVPLLSCEGSRPTPKTFRGARDRRWKQRNKTTGIKGAAALMRSNFGIGGSWSGYSRRLCVHPKIIRQQERPRNTFHRRQLNSNSIYKQNKPKVQPAVITRGHLLTDPRPRT